MRQPHVEHVQTKQQVFAEIPLLDELRQILVACRNDADVDAAGAPILADLLHLAVFQGAQQHHLEPWAHRLDFIKKQGAAVGELELARLVAVRSREGTAHMTEELRSQ